MTHYTVQSKKKKNAISFSLSLARALRTEIGFTLVRNIEKKWTRLRPAPVLCKPDIFSGEKSDVVLLATKFRTKRVKVKMKDPNVSNVEIFEWKYFGNAFVL